MTNTTGRLSAGITRGNSFTIEVDGETISAYEGETVAAALIAHGKNVFRKTKNQNPRGLYCGMGQCQECRMIINGVPDTLACQTHVTPGMKIETGS